MSMKIKLSQLRQIIAEEVQHVVREGSAEPFEDVPSARSWFKFMRSKGTNKGYVDACAGAWDEMVDFAVKKKFRRPELADKAALLKDMEMGWRLGDSALAFHLNKLIADVAAGKTIPSGAELKSAVADAVARRADAPPPPAGPTAEEKWNSDPMRRGDYRST